MTQKEAIGSATAIAPTDDPGEGLAVEMAAAWARGERLPAEHYLGRRPELRELPEEAVRLIYEEVCLRQQRGEEVSADELACRFPHWAAELTVMLECHRLVEARLAPPQFPAAGELLGDFQLLAELGRGRARPRLPGDAVDAGGSTSRLEGYSMAGS